MPLPVDTVRAHYTGAGLADLPIGHRTPVHERELAALFDHREITTRAAGSQGGTSRSIFSAFCDSREKGQNPLSGGIPQIVSLDRRSGGQVIGFVAEGTQCFYGLSNSGAP